MPWWRVLRSWEEKVLEHQTKLYSSICRDSDGQMGIKTRLALRQGHRHTKTIGVMDDRLAVRVLNASSLNTLTNTGFHRFKTAIRSLENDLS